MCLGGSSEPRLLRRAPGGAEGRVGRVRFRRGRDIDHRLRDREFALGRAEKVVGVLRGVADHQRLRIGEADILDRHAHHAAREIERVLAGIEHAREIIERGVRIGAAHRFVQRRDQIVMAVLRLVVDRRAPLHDRPASAAASKISPARAARQTSSASVSAARPSPSAMRTSDGARLGVERQRLAFDLLGARQQLLDRLGVERLEHQHARARQQRAR